jgi:hypothetical protein
LEPTECSASALEEAASGLRQGVDALGNVFGMPKIPPGYDFKMACQKTVLSGNKF